jgi:putative DNA primase/helicase
MSHIGTVAKGNWRHLLASLGVDSRFLVNKHGPCPICEGKDRFRWDNQNDGGGFICSQCGGGDGFDLARRVTGKSFREIADHIATVMGTTNEFERKGPDIEEQRQLDAICRGWRLSGLPKLDGPVGWYLRERVGCLWPSNAIREAVSKTGTPTMVCKIEDHQGLRIVNLHLTFLTPEGRKADVTPNKRVMPGKLPPGCAIRLGPVKSVMGVAEGIETAISAAIMYDMPVWACVNGTLLSQWIPPEGVESVTVFGDNDANFTGQAKAYHLANRLEVQFKRRVTVAIPPVPGQDWNDFWHEDENLPKTHSPKMPGFLRLVK